ncbi:MAG: hypothetical protein F6K40_23100 [Okeania sp. SIO3I5]|uniref:hypothetical protein n=1 Tax=Okeania sp. SIO3I5 TaxID=2607805 RepID=UPI0013B8CC61|nr:hypothetical protein [Okeania sp. SIO3I5]NEQ38997.1 hypothetical protein [Okeania sp. SIO3I5]
MVDEKKEFQSIVEAVDMLKVLGNSIEIIINPIVDTYNFPKKGICYLDKQRLPLAMVKHKKRISRYGRSS